MNTDRRAYYLHHMGLEQWIERPARASKNIPWFVLASHYTEPVSPKARHLLQNLLHALQIAPQDVHVDWAWSGDLMALQNDLRRCSPKILIILSAKIASIILKTNDVVAEPTQKHAIYHNIPVMVSEPLDHLLQSPLKKKIVYEDWLARGLSADHAGA